MISGSIPIRRLFSLFMVICILILSIPDSTAQIQTPMLPDMAHSIASQQGELQDSSIAAKTYEGVETYNTFDFISVSDTLETGIVISPEFDNIVRITKCRPQMARQNLSEDTEHLF